MSTDIENLFKEDAEKESEEISSDGFNIFSDNKKSDASQQTFDLFNQKSDKSETDTGLNKPTFASASNQKKPTLGNIFTEVDVTSPGDPYVKTVKDIQNMPYTTPEGLILKSYNKLERKNITKESLLKDASFMSDARTLLKTRHNYDDDELDTPDKIWEAWTERQRYYDTANEFTLARDFDYLYESDDDDVKLSRAHRYGRLLDVWEKYKGEDMSFRKAQDYGGAFVTSPSTAFAFMLGGKAPLGIGAKGTVLKTGLRVYLKNFLKGAAVVAPVEFGVGYVQSAGKEKLRSMTMKEEYRPGVVGLETAVQGAGGSMFGGFSSLLETRTAAKQLDLKQQFTTAKTETKNTRVSKNSWSRRHCKNIQKARKIKS